MNLGLGQAIEANANTMTHSALTKAGIRILPNGHRGLVEGKEYMDHRNKMDLSVGAVT